MIPDPRQAQSPKGTLIGTMPALDADAIRRAQEQQRGPGTSVSGGGGAVPLDPKDKK